MDQQVHKKLKDKEGGQESDEQEDRDVKIKSKSSLYPAKLLNMPYETLVDILLNCNTFDLIQLISSCRFLRDLSLKEERRLYRHLYHLELSKGSLSSVALARPHMIYSPKKSSHQISIPLSSLLPADSVYSWKKQLEMTILWRRSHSRRCMTCCRRTLASEEPIYVHDWKYQGCRLVPQNDLTTYRLTTKDLKCIKPISLQIMSNYRGPMRNVYYSRIHLLSIGLQSHGEAFIPKAVDVEKLAARKTKEILVEVATILHGGCWYSLNISGIYGVTYPSNNGQFSQEFFQYINGVSYKNNSGLKSRPLASILNDYIKFVKSVQNHPSFEEYFLPAVNPGPTIPTPESIAAYTRFCDTSDIGRNLIRTNKVEIRVTLQNYLLDPSRHNWIILSETARNSTLSSERGKLSSGIAISSKDYRHDFSQIRKVNGNRLLTALELSRLQVRTDTTQYTQAPWFDEYFKTGKLVSTLRNVYRNTHSNRSTALVDIAKEIYAPRQNIYSFSWLKIIRLASSYYVTNNQRCHRRLILHPLSPSKSEVVAEIKELLKDFEAGTLLVNSVQPDILDQSSDCPCFGQKGARCMSICWFERIGSEPSFCHGCGDYH